MLKKLVKYGNSNALVLDRAILELLNIGEGSVLKLRIEGEMLTIRAAETVKPTDSLMLDVENIHNRIRSVSNSPVMDMAEEQMRKYCQKIEKNPNSVEMLKEWLPGTENGKKLQEAFAKTMGKYQNTFKKLGSKEFLDDYNLLLKKYKGDASSRDLFKEFLALRLKHAPELAKMDKEMKEALVALGYPFYFDVVDGKIKQ